MHHKLSRNLIQYIRWLGVVALMAFGLVALSQTLKAMPLKGGQSENSLTSAWIETLVDDYELVFAPHNITFGVENFLASQNSALSNHTLTTDSGGVIQASDAILGISYKHSINPKVLLTLLEMQAGLVTNPTVPPSRLQSPFGNLSHVAGDYGKAPTGFIEQLDWAAMALSKGFYARRDDASSTEALILRDGTAIKLDITVNPGSYSVQYMLSKILGNQQWTEATDQSSGTFIQTFHSFFGDPLQSPGYPQAISTIPGAALPFEGGKTWYFSGGPHGGGLDGSERPWSAVDFASPDTPGCDDDGDGEDEPDLDDWIAASRGGEVLFAASSLIVIDHGDGWRTHYYHVSSQEMQVQAGDAVLQGRLLGHPSCETDMGGDANGDHVHFATSYNGTQITVNGNEEADGMVLEGWTINEGVAHYFGTIESPDGIVCGSPNSTPNCPVTSANYMGTLTTLTFTSEPNLIIPDNNVAGAIDTINIPVAEQGILLELEVKLTIDHETVEDLVAEIQSPEQAELNQWTRIFHRPGIPGAGCPYADVNAYFKDGGALSSEQCNPFSPALWGYAYAPLDPFSDYNFMNIVGPWRIKVSDITAVNIGTGTLLQWQIIAHVITPSVPTPSTTAYCHFPSEPIPIPDNNSQGMIDTIVVNEPEMDVNDLDAYLYITHTYVSDLSINLFSPSGSSVSLIDPPVDSCALDGIHAILDDEAAISIDGVCESHEPFVGLPAIFGTFQPEDENNPLSTFDNEPFSGAWSIEIVDSVANDEGSLLGWCLLPVISDPPTPTPTNTPTPTPTNTPTPTPTNTPTPTPTSIPTPTPTSPCAASPGGPCEFDSRAFVVVDGHTWEQITAYGRFFKFDYSANYVPGANNGQLLTSIGRYSQSTAPAGPCTYAPAGELCRFDTRAFVEVDGHTWEQITAYGRFFKFDYSANYVPGANNGQLLTSIGRYSQSTAPAGPCTYAPAGELCRFDTRAFVEVDGHTWEHITAYGRFFKFDYSANYVPGANNGQLLTSIGRYSQLTAPAGPCAYAPTGELCQFDSRAFVIVSGHTWEQITAYGRFFKFDYSNNYVPGTNNGSLLEEIGRYNQ